MLKVTARAADSVGGSEKGTARAGMAAFPDSTPRAADRSLLRRTSAATVFTQTGLMFAAWFDHLVFGVRPVTGASLQLFSAMAFFGLLLLPLIWPLQLAAQVVIDATGAQVRRVVWCVLTGAFVFAAAELLFSLLVWAVYPGPPVDRSHRLAYASGIPLFAALGFQVGRRLYRRPVPKAGPVLVLSGCCLMFHCIVAWLPPVFASGTTSHLFHNSAAGGLILSLAALAALVALGLPARSLRSIRLVLLSSAAAILLLGIRYPLVFRDHYAVRDVAARAGRFSRSVARHTRYVLYPASHGLQYLGSRTQPAPREEFGPQGDLPGDLLARLAATRPRNILLVTVDALRMDAFEATPSTGWGRLAREGVTFARHQSGAPGTREALATLFTGRPFFGDRAARARTLFHPYRERGYFTLAVGYAPGDRPDDKPYLDRAVVGNSLEAIVPRPEVMEAPFASMLTDSLLAQLGGLGERAFVAWAHYLDPHTPYEGKGWPQERYRSEVAATGREVDRLLEGLAARGVLDQTLVVLTADHGEEFGEHAGANHNLTLYQEVLHVPLVMRAPGGRVRGRILRRTSAEDVHGAIGWIMDGSAVRPSEMPPFAREDVFSFTAIQASKDRPVGLASVVRGRFKLIYELRLRSAELYDLESDPAETINLVDQRADIAATLARILWAELAEHGVSII